MAKQYPLQCIFLLFTVLGLHSQEVEIPTLSDFDLKGRVRSCLVITPYGRETFEFDPKGQLTRTITQYNELDQDITEYRLVAGELVERRLESYKNTILDESTSMANFYTIDTLPVRKVVEKIISYDKQFLEKQEYQYTPGGRLKRIITSNVDGVDETTFEYSPLRDGETISTYTNGILEKSIRTTVNQGPGGNHRSVLTKEYLDGQPNRAHEEKFNGKGKLISSEDFRYDFEAKEFVSQLKKYYHYKEGVLDRVVTRTLNSESVENYIFQFDNHKPPNWVKQIIAPHNSYTTRVISYYPEEAVEQQGEQ